MRLSIEDTMGSAPIATNMTFARPKFPPGSNDCGLSVVKHAKSSIPCDRRIIKDISISATTVAAVAVVPKRPDNKPSDAKVKRKADETEAEFKRRRNTHYAQTYKQRHNDQLQSLSKQIVTLQQSNAALRLNNQQLEGFLARARWLASVHENNNYNKS